MVVGNNKLTATKNAGKSMVISIAMAMDRYDAGRITRWSTSRASFEATGCHHRLSACAVLPRRLPWLTNSNKLNKTLKKHNFYLATTVHFDRYVVVCDNFNPLTDPLLSSLMHRASFKCETPQLELESSATFLAIKRCQQTQFVCY